MNVKKQIEYWLTTAKSDLETAQLIFDAGKNYHHCLFFCHLALEKGLKANVVKATRVVPPKIHSLLLLAQKADMQISVRQKSFFVLMNTFNIEGRYPDMRYQVYRRATGRLARKLLEKTKEQFEWMEKRARQ